jgi:hypothetical protein
MTHIFKTNDKKEALRLMKSTDMAIALFHITRNLKKEAINKYESISLDYIEPLDVFIGLMNEKLDELGIDIDELID